MDCSESGGHEDYAPEEGGWVACDPPGRVEEDVAASTLSSWVNVQAPPGRRAGLKPALGPPGTPGPRAGLNPRARRLKL